MNPEPPSLPPTDWFGRSPRQVARGAFWLALVGAGLVSFLVRLLTRRGTPLGELATGLGIQPGPLLGLGLGFVALLTVYGYFRAVRVAERFRVTAGGLEAQGPFGSYRITWDNLAAAGVAAGGGLGLRLHSREQLLESHTGSTQQREWLRTMAPFGEWDLVYPRAVLGVEAAQVLAWLEAARPGASGNPAILHDAGQQ